MIFTARMFTCRTARKAKSKIRMIWKIHNEFLSINI